jgi:opacity protein-like surface antigen
MKAMLAIVLCGLSPLVALGQESAYVPSRGMYLGVTSLRPDADRRLARQEGHTGLIVGHTWRRSRHLAIDLSVLDTGQQANMPRVERSRAAASGSRMDAHINITGIAVGAKLTYPIGNFEPYAGAGAGYYAAEISSWGSFVHLLLPSDFAKRSDSDVGTHWTLGVDYAISPTALLSLEYRRLSLEANFGPEFGGKTKLGGGMIIVAIRSVVR